MGKLLATFAFLLPLVAYLAVFGGQRFDPETVRGQRVLVTGASSGIGEQLAYQCARLGARLVITARREGLLRNVSRTCEKLGAPQVHWVAADMADPEDRARVLASVEDRLGGLDYLILNHAVLNEGWWLGTPDNLTRLEQVFRLNFLSYADLASKALPLLEASRGRIGVVSSVFGVVGSTQASVYSSAKFALHGFFSSLRQELRLRDTGVSVTLAVLGPVATDAFLGLTDVVLKQLPRGFMVSAEDAARAVIESVAQRHYWLVFDWKIRQLLLIDSLWPQFFEDSVAAIMQNDDRTWMPRLMMYIFRTFYGLERSSLEASLPM